MTPAVDCKSEACCYAAYNAAICAGVSLTSCFCNGVAISCPTTCTPPVPGAAGKGSKKGLLGLLGLLGIIPAVLFLACCLAACLRRRKRGADVMFASYPMPAVAMPDVALPGCAMPAVAIPHVQPACAGIP